MHSPKLSVLITVPLSVSYEKQFVHRDVVNWLVGAMTDKNFDVTISLPTGMPIEENRNRIMKRFVDEGYDFLLSIDADNPPTGNCLNYCFLDKDILGFPTPVFRWKKGMEGEPPIHFNAYDYHREHDGYIEHPNRHGTRQVDAVGAGCILIARRVAVHPRMARHSWQRTYDKDGFIDRGSDIAFCERARSAGFEVWTTYDCPADHVKGCSLNMIWKGFMSSFQKWLKEHREEAATA